MRQLGKLPMCVTAVVLASAAVLGMPVTAFAAMEAILSSDHARPGDTILLLTNDHSGSWDYGGLAQENHQEIYVAPATSTGQTEGCGGAGSRLIGMLAWRGNAGGLSFAAPNLPTGDYWLFMLTGGQCWRIGGDSPGSSGILVLSIGPTPADNQDAASMWTVEALTPSPRPIIPTSDIHATSRGSFLPWLGVVGVGALALLIGAIAWRGLRTGSPN